MNGPVSLRVAKLAREKLSPVSPTGQPHSSTSAQERVYTALELILAAFLDEIIGDLEAEQQSPTQHGGGKR